MNYISYECAVRSAILILFWRPERVGEILFIGTLGQLEIKLLVSIPTRCERIVLK
jgi:hypothetical protein